MAKQQTPLLLDPNWRSQYTLSKYKPSPDEAYATVQYRKHWF